MDLQILDILHLIVKRSQPIEDIEKRVDEVFTRYAKLGKIFKFSDYHILKAICCVYMRSYDASIPHFMDAIK